MIPRRPTRALTDEEVEDRLDATRRLMLQRGQKTGLSTCPWCGGRLALTMKLMGPRNHAAVSCRSCGKAAIEEAE